MSKFQVDTTPLARRSRRSSIRRYVITLIAMACVASGFGMSTDTAGNTMVMLISSAGVVAADAAGNQMFQVIAGPSFAKGTDFQFNSASPFSAEYFTVPVTLSRYSIE